MSARFSVKDSNESNPSQSGSAAVVSLRPSKNSFLLFPNTPNPKGLKRASSELTPLVTSKNANNGPGPKAFGVPLKVRPSEPELNSG